MTSTLDSGIKLVKNVSRFSIGVSSINTLHDLLNKKRAAATQKGVEGKIIFIVDEYFKRTLDLKNQLDCRVSDTLEYISTEREPTTDYIDYLVRLLNDQGSKPAAVVGMGGGVTMDCAKAVSNLLTNGGQASDYQGWDLLKLPGIFKVGIPTISGTGAEATRTCVMTNPVSGLKLGMNSDFTVFDHVIMDPDLTATVPRNQYFYTGMDAYIHCIESLAGTYRNPIGDSFSRETLNLCRQIFLDEDMQSQKNRERLMVASYLGGCAIATSYVGLVHPLSAGLSVVFGIHHCLANCIVMHAMEEFYPEAYQEFWKMSEMQNVVVPKGVCLGSNDDVFMALFNASIMHEKPLTNALGVNFKSILTLEKVTELFKKM